MYFAISCGSIVSLLLSDCNFPHAVLYRSGKQTRTRLGYSYSPFWINLSLRLPLPLLKTCERVSIAPLPGQDLTTPAPKMAGYEFRLATVKEARNELLLYLKKKLFLMRGFRAIRWSPPSRWMTGPFLFLDLVNSCRDELNYVPCPAACQSHRKVVGSAETSFGKELYHKAPTRYYHL